MKKLMILLVCLVLALPAYADYLGTYRIDDLLTFGVNVHSPANGAATAADAAPQYWIFKDMNYMGAAMSGTLASTDPNVAGIYRAQVTLSATNGFTTNSVYRIDVNASVGGIAGTKSDKFQILATPFDYTVNKVIVGTNDDKDGNASTYYTNLKNSIDANGNAIQAKTGLIPASPDAVGSAMTLDSATHTLIAADVNAGIASAATAVVIESYVEAALDGHAWTGVVFGGVVDANKEGGGRY